MSTNMSTSTIAHAPQICPGCGGSGVQTNKVTGLNVICPVCGGTGKWTKPEESGTVNC